MPRHWPVERKRLYSNETTSELTEQERSRFVDLTNKIREGLSAFRVVGESMKEIRDSRLYRENYATWEKYLKAEWGWGKNYVDRQIIASNFARIADEVSDNVLVTNGHQTLPKLTSERIVRELVKVNRNTSKDTKALVAEAISFASSNGKLTAKTMREAVNVVAPPKPKAPKTRQDAPESIEELAKPFSSVVADLRAIGQRIKDLGLSKLQSVDAAISEVRQWTPTELCPDCKKEKSCLTCSGKGWLGKWQVEARRKGRQ